MALAPRRIRDLADHGLESLAVAREAVVDADRIEDEAEIARAREQSNGTARSVAEAMFDQLADTDVEWPLRVAEMIGAVEAHRRPTFDRP